MAKITVNMDIEVDDALVGKVVDLLSKTTETATMAISKTTETATGVKLPEGLELEVKDVGGKLLLKVVGVGEREGDSES